jgi:hypothetical protein
MRVELKRPFDGSPTTTRPEDDVRLTVGQTFLQRIGARCKHHLVEHDIKINTLYTSSNCDLEIRFIAGTLIEQHVTKLIRNNTCTVHFLVR